MLKFISKLLGGSKSDKEVKQAFEQVQEINKIYSTLITLTDEDLKLKTSYFKDKVNSAINEFELERSELKNKLVNEALSADDVHQINDRIKYLNKSIFETSEEVLDDILPEAFAVVKEVCRRLTERKHTYIYAGNESVWAMIPYDVQLVGGIVLHNGQIAEMQTGEGKTLSAILPLYLNAITGKGVHLVTVNDYLAKRDCDWMKPVFNFLDIKVGAIQSNMDNQERNEMYLNDITYGTNNEFGFDYLRDNMVTDFDEKVQREHWFAVVDEVDSVLIDEARTPLIISGPVNRTDQKFDEMKGRVKRLVDTQAKLVNEIVANAVNLLAKQDKDSKEEAGVQILRATHGLPKHKRLQKLLQDTEAVKLRHTTEMTYMRDQNRRMHEIDDELYYTVDEKTHQIDITEKGRELLCNAQEDPNLFLLPDITSEISMIEGDTSLSQEDKQQKIDSAHLLYSERSDRMHTVNQLLRAYSLYEKDVEYVIQDSKIMIVDEHTGRILDGRRYSDGLHQAIEAKENVMVEKDTQTLATITLQNYFRLYHKLAGMTGTAETEAPEFEKIYKLEVVSIPSNRPLIRKDLNDVIYKTKREKYNAIADDVIQLLAENRAVLVGTATVEVSEILSKMFKAKGIPHNVLNAKNHAREAEIISDAGKKGACTIATNMAGRGTDIKIDETVRIAGGLAIVGSERHDARRIDRQLRGRSGRQGDPGSSKFYISLEDNLIRLFGASGERVAKVMESLKIPEGEAIEHSMISKTVESAQKKVEENNFGIRKRLIDYDDVMNQQREVIYTRRKHALSGERLRGELMEYVEELAENWYEEYHQESMNLKSAQAAVRANLLSEIKLNDNEFETITSNEFVDKVVAASEEFYTRKEEMLSEDFMRQLEKVAVLQTIDEKWREHLRTMDDLKEGIHLRSYGQKDPLLEYKKEAYDIFVELLGEINKESVQFAFKFFPQVVERNQLESNRPKSSSAPVLRNTNITKNLNFTHSDVTPSYLQEPTHLNVNNNERDSSSVTTFKRVDAKIGRNDLVTVRYSDGSVKQEKYKKVEKDVEAGNCFIV
jgi:preprotein translocase subunit SecA